MITWRDLGLGRGAAGKEFSANGVTCPYCDNHGKFNRVFHGESREVESGETLNSDVWQCLVCANFLFVVWRTEAGFFDYRSFPYEKSRHVGHPAWPASAAHAYEEALLALLTEDWDTAQLLARRAIGEVTRLAGVSADDLAAEVAQLCDQGKIPRALEQWASVMPQLKTQAGGGRHGGDPAHAAREVVRFARYLFDALYTLPYDAERYRKRE